MANNSQNYAALLGTGIPLQPAPQYVQAADVSFGPSGVVIPHELPPSSMRFPNATANKMLNLPTISSIYENPRNGTPT